jgi:hypothetical protein
MTDTTGEPAEPEPAEPEPAEPEPAEPEPAEPEPAKDAVPAEARGAVIVQAAYLGTAVFCAAAIAAVADADLEIVAVAVDLLLFAGGVVAFLWAYAIAIGRSRDVLIGIGGLYFLQGSAPNAVRLRLLGALTVQVAVAFITAGLRPFTGLAFGILVPMWGLGLCGLWGARYGTFPPRAQSEAESSG